MTETTVRTRPRWRLTAPALVVLCGISALTVAAWWGVRSEVENQERQALERRSGEFILTLSGGLSEVRSALGVLSNVEVTAPGSPEVFERAAQPLLTGSVRFVGVAERTGSDFSFIAAIGDGVPLETPIVGERADLVRRASAATDFVSTVLHDSDGSRIAFALAAAGGSRVVVRETAINPAPVASLRGRPFSDIDAALYAAPTPEPSALVLATTSTVPLSGRTFSQTAQVGEDTWLMVTTSRGSLVGSFTQRAPMATLLTGLMLAVLLAAIVESLARRRGYALALVEERTAALQATLKEQARLEREARHASAEASAANRSKSEFLSRMSHELRTPLNAVLGFAQLLELDHLTDEQRESVDQITKGGRHLLDLINEVLDITRIESGNFTLSPEAVLAGDVLGETLDLMRPLAEDQRIHLVGDAMATCDVHVFADRQRLKQILLNLLANAVKYNRVGGTVAVSCKATSGRLRLNVSDTGPGIAPEYLDRLFQPFERLGAEHGDVEGTGIGLALSRRLAEAMGGTVDVDTTVGRGSTFWVELPVVEGPVERYVRLGATIDHSVESNGDGRHTIVYIEDNLSNLRLVEQVLAKRDNVELVSAMQGRLGLDLVRQHNPIGVLLDLHLPDIDGEEILRELRDDPMTASTPVIILSADATPGHIQRLLTAGARAYLTKPLDVRQLLATLDILVETAEQPTRSR